MSNRIFRINKLFYCPLTITRKLHFFIILDIKDGIHELEIKFNNK